MSLFNEILVGRFSGILHKLLNMKEGAPSPTLATDISPGITLESDRPEWMFLAGEFRSGKVAQAVADVANFTVAGLFNGQATGVLVIVEAITINNQTVGTLSYEIRVGTTTALTGGSSSEKTDLRWNKLSAARSGSALEAVLTGSRVYLVTVPAGSSVRVPLVIILPPNTVPLPTGQLIPNVTVNCTVINQAINATFEFRERGMEQSESR